MSHSYFNVYWLHNLLGTRFVELAKTMCSFEFVPLLSLNSVLIPCSHNARSIILFIPELFSLFGAVASPHFAPYLTLVVCHGFVETIDYYSKVGYSVGIVGYTSE